MKSGLTTVEFLSEGLASKAALCAAEIAAASSFGGIYSEGSCSFGATGAGELVRKGDAGRESAFVLTGEKGRCGERIVICCPREMGMSSGRSLIGKSAIASAFGISGTTFVSY